MSKEAEEHVDHWIMADYDYNSPMVADWKLVREELKDLRAKVAMQHPYHKNKMEEICYVCDGSGNHFQHGAVIKCSKCQGTGKIMAEITVVRN